MKRATHSLLLSAVAMLICSCHSAVIKAPFISVNTFDFNAPSRYVADPARRMTVSSVHSSFYMPGKIELSTVFHKALKQAGSDCVGFKDVEIEQDWIVFYLFFRNEYTLTGTPVYKH